MDNLQNKQINHYAKDENKKLCKRTPEISTSIIKMNIEKKCEAIQYGYESLKNQILV